MTATRTRTDLVNQALANLGVTDPNEIASAEDFTTANNHYDTAMAQLDAKGIVAITDETDIPLELFSPLAICLAEDAAPSFGRATKYDAVRLAEAEIRTIVRSRPSFQPLQVDYF